MRTAIIIVLALAGAAGAAVGIWGVPPCCPFGSSSQATAATVPTSAAPAAWSETPCCPGHDAQPVAAQPVGETVATKPTARPECDTPECPAELCDDGDDCGAAKKAECEKNSECAKGNKVQ